MATFGATVRVVWGRPIELFNVLCQMLEGTSYTSYRVNTWGLRLPGREMVQQQVNNVLRHLQKPMISQRIGDRGPTVIYGLIVRGMQGHTHPIGLTPGVSTTRRPTTRTTKTWSR